MPITTLGLVLLVASLVAIASRRFGLPYSVGLVTGGVALALLPLGPELPLSRDLIFGVFLPPLIFEASLKLKWQDFRRELPVTALLAFPGIVIAAAAVAAGAHWGLGWSWTGALLFGSLIAATDPVSVLASFRELSVDRRLCLVMESESILNDGTAAVAFGIVAGVALGAPATPLAIAGTLGWTVVGGVAVGLGIGAAMLLISRNTDDRLVETTLTVIAAYGAFLVADALAMSGVLATMSAGILIGNLGWRGSTISQANRPHVEALWDFAAFLANSVVFILIGSQQASHGDALFSLAAAAAIGMALAGRALAVYPLCALLVGSRLRVAARHQHVLIWGGLRGALALALALGLPAGVAERETIVGVTFAVVAFSIFVQGLTTPWLIRRLGVSQRV